MAKMHLSNAGALLRASGWNAVALALAMMAAPTEALSQDRGWGHWNADSSQTQSSGDESGSKDRKRSSGKAASTQDAPQTRYRARSESPQTSQNAAPAWRRRQHNAPETADHADGMMAQPQGTPGRFARVQQQDQGGFSQERSVPDETSSDPDRNRTYRDRSHDNQDANNRRDRRDGNRDDRNGWRDTDRHDWRDGDRNHWRDGRHASRDWGSRRWNRDWRQDRRRYDWDRYRNTHRHVYRLGRYHAPYGNYRYRHLSAGFFLDTIFFSSRYWIADPWHYRLPPAYGPYRWVRYYDDVLLVDIYTGEVVDVIHDFFW